jgi:hypothetical protein
MKELSDDIKSMLNFMGGLSRKLALSNLYDRKYDIAPYLTDLINKSNNNLRRNGFVKASNPHKDVIVYKLKKAGKFVFKEEKDKRYELIVNPTRQSI